MKKIYYPVLCSFFLTVACGGSDDNGSTDAPALVDLSPLKESYCTILMKADVKSDIEWISAEAKNGQSYLVNKFSDQYKAVVPYSSEDGPSIETITVEEGSYEFENNCDATAATQAVLLQDLNVFSDDNLTNQVCALKQGTTSEGGISSSASLKSGTSSKKVYEISSNFITAESCGDHNTFYASGGPEGALLIPLPTN